MAAPRSDPPELAAAKRAARREALAIRAACRPEWGIRLAGHVLAGRLVPAGAVVGGFWPIGDEIDVRPLLLALHGRGHAVALPSTPPRGQALGFRAWRPGAVLARERFGTWAPDGPELLPDVLLVPLLAFDGAGRRLGYGGGYYDRTLAALPGRLAIGCAYAAQRRRRVPSGEHDRTLAAVATERGISFPEE